MKNKKCTVCGKTKPVSDFYKQTRKKKHGHKEDRIEPASQCKECSKIGQRDYYHRNRGDILKKHNTPDMARQKRARKLEQKYGLSISEYDDLVDMQGGRCAVCGGEPGVEKSLCVDHCHETGKIRGLLCSRCNRCIGQLGDDTVLLVAATRYLRSSEPRAIFWEK